MQLEDFTEQLRKDKVFDVFDVIRVTDASTKAEFEEGSRIPKNATVLVKRAPNAEFKPTKRNIRLAKQQEQERERDGLPAAASAPTTRKGGSSAYGEADETARLAMAQQQQQSAFGYTGYISLLLCLTTAESAWCLVCAVHVPFPSDEPCIRCVDSVPVLRLVPPPPPFL